MVLKAHWRHVANTIEPMLPSDNPGPQPKRQIDQFSRSCAAQGRTSQNFTMSVSFPQNCPFPWVYLYAHLIHGSVGHLSPQHKRHLDRFSRFCRRPQSVPIPYNGTPAPRLKIASSWGSGPHLDRFGRFCRVH